MFIIRCGRSKLALLKPTLLPHLPKERQWKNHKSVLSSFGLSTKDDECGIPSMYWIPKLYKNLYKQRYKAGTATLSRLLTSILKAVKKGLQSDHDTCFCRSAINSMLILKNSKDILETLNSRLLSENREQYQWNPFFQLFILLLFHTLLNSRLKNYIYIVVTAVWRYT